MKGTRAVLPAAFRLAIVSDTDRRSAVEGDAAMATRHLALLLRSRRQGVLGPLMAYDIATGWPKSFAISHNCEPWT